MCDAQKVNPTVTVSKGNLRGSGLVYLCLGTGWMLELVLVCCCGRSVAALGELNKQGDRVD